MWEIEIKHTKNDEIDVDVVLSEKVYTKILHLMLISGKMEWLAYLIGDKKNYKVTDIYIPEQVVTSVHVDVIVDCDVPIIGVIHSHHEMGNKFSHTDDEFINGNHDISLCISINGISGNVREMSDDGGYNVYNANVIIPEYISNLMDEYEDNVKIKTFEESKIVEFLQLNNENIYESFDNIAFDELCELVLERVRKDDVLMEQMHLFLSMALDKGMEEALNYVYYNDIHNYDDVIWEFIFYIELNYNDFEHDDLVELKRLSIIIEEEIR